jgi:hypothetical protein
MNKSRAIRLSKFACIGIFLTLGLSACVDVIYKDTGGEISMKKTASPSFVAQAGEVITYTYEIKNNTIGPKPSEEQQMGNDALFPLSPITIAVTDSPLDGPVVCNATVLKSGESTTCKATYTVTENDIANGGVTNNAVVTGSFTSNDKHYFDKDEMNKTVKANHTVTVTASVTIPVGLSVPTASTEPAVTQAQPTVTPTLPSPILTGEVTYCNAATFTMNLRFDHSFVPSNFNHQVTINGEPMVCGVNESNSSLLLCSYLSSAVFPANIKVSIDNIVVNDFMYDGAACIIPATPTKEPDRPESAPTACPVGMVCP